MQKLIDKEIYSNEIDSDDEVDSHWVIGLSTSKKDLELREHIQKVIQASKTEYDLIKASVDL